MKRKILYSFIIFMLFSVILFSLNTVSAKQIINNSKNNIVGKWQNVDEYGMIFCRIFTKDGAWLYYMKTSNDGNLTNFQCGKYYIEGNTLILTQMDMAREDSPFSYEINKLDKNQLWLQHSIEDDVYINKFKKVYE